MKEGILWASLIALGFFAVSFGIFELFLI